MADIALPIDASGGVPSFPAAQERAARAALVATGTNRPLGALSGVTPGAEPAITAPTATTWQVTPFKAIVDPGTALAVGPYQVAITANKTGAINPADANNQRLDRLDLVVPDDPAGAFGTSPVVQYTPGVAGSGLPGAPARSIPLATITVPKATTGNPSVAATFPWTSAAGGIVPARGVAYPAHPYVGQYVDDATVGLLRWSGSKWEKCDSRNAPHFWGATGAALAIASNTNIAYTPVEDPYSNWNASTNAWTVPRGGLYQINSQAKWGNGNGPSTTGSAVLKARKNGSAAILGPNADAVGNFQGMLLSGFIRCASGDTLSMISQGAFTTQDDTPAQSTYVTMLWVCD